MRTRSTDSTAVLFASLLLASLLLVTATGCPPTPASVGAPCDLGIPTTSGDVTISSPSLECAGGLCLQVGTGPARCSAECGSDDDCANDVSANASLCQHGFACRAATSVGMYACRSLCVCLDLLPAPPVCEFGL